MEKAGTVLTERSLPASVVLTGAADSKYEPELRQALDVAYRRMKADKSNLHVRREFPNEPPIGKTDEEFKCAGIAEIGIALLNSTGAAVAAINAIASAIKRSRSSELVITVGGREIGNLKCKGFDDSALVASLAAQMIQSDVELRIHVGDSVKP